MRNRSLRAKKLTKPGVGVAAAPCPWWSPDLHSGHAGGRRILFLPQGPAGAL